jgi:hypothetical protein
MAPLFSWVDRGMRNSDAGVHYRKHKTLEWDIRELKNPFLKCIDECQRFWKKID